MMEKKLSKKLAHLTNEIHKLGEGNLFKSLGILEIMKEAIKAIHEKHGKDKD